MLHRLCRCGCFACVLALQGLTLLVHFATFAARAIPMPRAAQGAHLLLASVHLSLIELEEALHLLSAAEGEVPSTLNAAGSVAPAPAAAAYAAVHAAMRLAAAAGAALPAPPARGTAPSSLQRCKALWARAKKATMPLKTVWLVLQRARGSSWDEARRRWL